MNRKINPLTAAAALGIFMLANAAFAQGTAFTYQGRLQNGTNLASGNYDLSFALYTNSSGGSAVAGPVTNLSVAVSNGLFTTIVSFPGNPFNGTSNWLELAVRTNGAASFSPPLSPRQLMSAVPYAVFAETANAAGLTQCATDRFVPIRMLIDQIPLDVADGPTAKMDDEPFGWIKSFCNRAVVLFDRNQVGGLSPPS